VVTPTPESTTRSIIFLSDFGYRNEWVGICHAPTSPVVDLSHGDPQQRLKLFLGCFGRVVESLQRGEVLEMERGVKAL
jgi:hypothetical protein